MTRELAGNVYCNIVDESWVCTCPSACSNAYLRRDREGCMLSLAVLVQNAVVMVAELVSAPPATDP
eukprot:1965173-Pyramimonas_sp.AAC.1